MCEFQPRLLDIVLATGYNEYGKVGECFMYHTAIFDLDGTLLDTLDDLHAAVNRALDAYGLPCRSRDEVRQFVGNGVARLMELAVPDGRDHPCFEDCLATFKEMYAKGCENLTKPYGGVCELLASLRARGVRVAIVSNKFDAAVKRLSDKYFGGLVEVAVGERESDGIRKKPAPDMIFDAIATLGVPLDGSVYVGDSDVDIETARAAGIPCISVTWGFRDRKFLVDRGAEMLADDTGELEDMICG